MESVDDLYREMSRIFDLIPDSSAESFYEFVETAEPVTRIWRLISDFETTMSSGGFEIWLGCPSAYDPEPTIEALQTIGCDKLAEAISAHLRELVDYPDEYFRIQNREDFPVVIGDLIEKNADKTKELEELYLEELPGMLRNLIQFAKRFVDVDEVGFD